MLYSEEQILSFKPCLVFYAWDSLSLSVSLNPNSLKTKTGDGQAKHIPLWTDTIHETDIRIRDKPSSAQVFFLWDVKFSPHLMFDLAQNEWNNNNNYGSSAQSAH